MSNLLETVNNNLNSNEINLDNINLEGQLDSGKLSKELSANSLPKSSSSASVNLNKMPQDAVNGFATG